METILTFAPELAKDPAALAEFEASCSDYHDYLDNYFEDLEDRLNEQP